MPVSNTSRVSSVRTAPAPRRSAFDNLKRFVRTPKGTVLWVLLALVAVAMVNTNRQTLPAVAAALGGAVGADLAATWLRQRRFLFPSGGILSGLFVAMVLARGTPAYAVLLTAALAVAAKHALRTRWSNVFNPAALGLIVGDFLFRSGQSWWGALPYDGVLGFLVILAAGWYIASKVNKLPLALTFLGVSLGVFTAASFMGASAQVAQVFRAPDINALVFFACLMLTDPPTSPAKQPDQIWFGATAGLLGAVVFLLFGVQWFILAGLPVANLAESLRRLAARPKPGARPARGGEAERAGHPPAGGRRTTAVGTQPRTAGGPVRAPAGRVPPSARRA